MTPPQAFRRRSASTPQTSGVRDRPGLLFLETQGLLLKNFQSLFMLFFFKYYLICIVLHVMHHFLRL